VKYLLLTLAALFLAGIWYFCKGLKSYRKAENETVRFFIILKNQEPWVEGFVRKLFRLAGGMPGLEIVVVDDGSSDQTLHILKRLQRAYPFALEPARELADIAGGGDPAGSYNFDARGLTGRDLLNAPVFSQLKSLSAGKSPGLSK
jgi:glycosyltransferase involved in cell wall biosynthesis